MAKLIYSAIASLDLYVADEQGKWDWALPDEEVHAFVNDLERPIGTHLFGRRMYEVLSAWETMDDPHPLMRDYAEIWRASDKIVYSRSLDSIHDRPHDTRARVRPRQGRRAEGHGERDLSIGGPHLAAQAIAAGLVDECHLLLSPVVVGGGNARAARRRPLRPRAAGRAPLRQRRRAPALRQS